MKTLVSILVLGIFSISNALAQKKVTVSGYIKDASNGEILPGALVTVTNPDLKASSNSYGFYSITLNPGKYTLNYNYLGFLPSQKVVTISKDTTISINLSSSSKMMDEVVVTSGRKSENVRKPITVTALSINKIKELPPMLGEPDVIKSFQLMPGVSTVGEGASGFNVRGGGVDQNLILLDEAPLYFTSHLFNLFSVTNPDAMRDATLYKSEMPARFGGRLSSVLDTRMKDGNNQKWTGAGGLGLIASRFTIEGPIKKDKSSLIVSGRRSYTDLFTKQSSDPAIRDNSIYFYDLSAKMNFTLSDKDRLFLSGYFGKDHIEVAKRFGMQWGNGTGTVRWNHVYSPRLFSNTSVIYSDYKYKLGVLNNPGTSFEWNAGIVDYSIKNGFNWYISSKSTAYFGVEGILHEFSPGKAEPTDAASSFNTVAMPGERAAEYNAYWDHELNLSDKFSFEYGIRYSALQSIANGNTTVYDYEGEVGKRKQPVNPQNFSDWETIKWYHNVQPRLAMKFQTSTNSSVKASYSRTAQNLHLVSNTIAASPLDIWTPSSYNIRPELADQFSLGYFRNLKDNQYEASVELYYRSLENQLDFINGAETLLNRHLPGDMVFGDGRAYGSEFFLKKNEGRLNGWISYTLSRAERRNPIFTDYYPVRHNKTHSLAVVAVYELKPRVVLSGTFNFASGTPTTLGDQQFEFDGRVVQYNSAVSRNNYRVPAYHRLDLSTTFKNKIKPGKKFTSEWVVSLYNASNRKNPFSIYMRQNENDPSKLEAVRLSVFGTVIPSVTWNFKF
ncbi:TonB-dependent receptor [Pedobacter sp. SYSU D00535]|uniref:TonB-dependent receptor n=1 Tax=Pedobacter sp. SYSU D00535 TaxID=2810308 RepID=UPI001A95BD18|nr:TonB-dependent receptor [Pedobacter sp. SYSU D00535]